MNILKRLSNAYRTNGFAEVLRKSFYYVTYKVHNRSTKRDVVQSELEYGLHTHKRDGHRIIVSLTSFPPRFEQMSLCLKSLVIQTLKPDRIIVYLGSDSNEAMLTDDMRKYQKYGVEYRFDDTQNLMPHKKYFYAMQEFPDDIVITADDDTIYPKDWVSSLMHVHQKYPKAICGRRVHLIRKDEFGNLRQYNHWLDQYRKERKPSFSLIATGCSGCLYPPNSLDSRAFDSDAIVRLCLRADDLWLKCMATLAGTPYVWVPNNEVSLGTTDESQDVSLASTNVSKSENDTYLENVMKAYGIKVSDFFGDVK